MKARNIIPNGLYCYTPKQIDEETGRMQIKACPFLANVNRDTQSSGYCVYMQKGDWGDSGTLLLWDQVKECGINYDD